MRIIRCNRNDLGLLLHKPVNVGNVFQFGNVAPMEQHYNSVIGNYVQDLNQFYQSDAYIQKANELLMYREDNYLDMSIYLIDSMDAIIGQGQSRAWRLGLACQVRRRNRHHP